MQRLILLAVFVFAGWYGWKHYDALLHPAPRHEAVVRNDSGEKLVRIRLTVGGHTYVKEELATGATVAFPFTVTTDSKFDLLWEYATNTMVGHWTGGLVAKGPMVARHTLTIRTGTGVVFESQPL